MIVFIVLLQNSRPCFKVCKEHKNELQWTYTVWSDCQLRPGHTECSIKNGVRYRNVTCMFRSNGRVEDDSVCWEFEAKPNSEESCDLKCPQDCVVTVFTPWSNSNCDNCLIVNKTRTRHLVVPPDPGKGGKPCPPFTEMIPCDNCTDVYTYKIGPWEECVPFAASFLTKGSVHPVLGYQRRRIHCVNSLGQTISS